MSQSPDLEAIADRWIHRAALPADQSPNAVELAEALIGPGCVRVADPSRLPPGLAVLTKGEGGAGIQVRRASRPALRWAVFHELGHWVAEQEGLEVQDEQLADALAYRLMSPRSAVLSASKRFDGCAQGIADHLRISRRLAALRLHQVGVHTQAGRAQHA